MTDAERLKYLKLVLRIVGAFAIFGFYPLTRVWASGWAWHSGQSEYLQMLIGIYATLGVFLIIAARDPRQHVGIVSFWIWSSLVHATVMTVQALLDPHHVGHLYGDVLVLFVAAAVLAVLSPEALRLPFTRPARVGGSPPAEAVPRRG